MVQLLAMGALICSTCLGVAPCRAEVTQSSPGQSGPALAPGMTPSSLGWGPDEQAYPERFVVSPRDGAEMVWVPAGEFTMGSPNGEGDDDEHPQHKVSLPAFWIDRMEVTNEQYAKFLEYLKRTGDHDGCHKGEAANKYHTPEYWTDPELNGSRQPVGGVDWFEAYAYAAWAGKRLPTEAEWEKAARGTDGRRYPWGDVWDVSSCSHWENGKRTPEDVGSHAEGRSPYGCLDMAGSVWEWCWDLYDEAYYRSSPRERPTGPADGRGRVFRGGSWDSASGDCRSTSRSVFVPFGCTSASCTRGAMVRYGDCGFRCVVTP